MDMGSLACPTWVRSKRQIVCKVNVAIASIQSAILLSFLVLFPGPYLQTAKLCSCDDDHKCHSIERLALIDFKKVIVYSIDRLSTGCLTHTIPKPNFLANLSPTQAQPVMGLSLQYSEAVLFLGPYLQTFKLCSCSDDHKVGNCHSIERLALLDFKKGVEDPSNRLSSWRLDNEDCCKWHGVGCNNVTGYVEELDLNTMKDTAQATKLSGGISPLARLKHLKYLDLSDNAFHKDSDRS
ncbi:hypothetical protein Syun_016170 [Stephania yunnanensis]|uniref:Leucine-rich repeat-containing N-terminal plant-type domain-containing protein n=1 Tax=Stephania yunnanensis TaxID=152371 RepID=A0AAP0P1Z3_9MAGN